MAVVVAGFTAGINLPSAPAWAQAEQQDGANTPPLPLAPVAALGRALTFIFESTISGTQNVLLGSAPEDIAVLSPPHLTAEAPVATTINSLPPPEPPTTINPVAAKSAQITIVNLPPTAAILPAPAISKNQPRVSAVTGSPIATATPKPAPVKPPPTVTAKAQTHLEQPAQRPPRLPLAKPALAPVAKQTPPTPAMRPASVQTASATMPPPVDSVAIIPPQASPMAASTLAPPPPSLGVGVHLASYRDVTESVAGWAELAEQSPTLRSGMKPMLVRHVLAGQSVSMYRLYAQPFGSLEQAREFCRQAMQAGLNYCQAHEIRGTLQAWPGS